MKTISLKLNRNALYQKVTAIKAHRTLTLAGLKESKDFIESAEDMVQKFNVTSNISDVDFREQVENLRYAGFIVDVVADTSKALLDQLKNISIGAISCNDFDLAIDLIDVLKRRI